MLLVQLIEILRINKKAINFFHRIIHTGSLSLAATAHNIYLLIRDTSQEQGKRDFLTTLVVQLARNRKRIKKDMRFIYYRCSCCYVLMMMMMLGFFGCKISSRCHIEVLCIQLSIQLWPKWWQRKSTIAQISLQVKKWQLINFSRLHKSSQNKNGWHNFRQVFFFKEREKFCSSQFIMNLWSLEQEKKTLTTIN